MIMMERKDVLDYISIIHVLDNILGKSHYALLIRDIRFLSVLQLLVLIVSWRTN